MTNIIIEPTLPRRGNRNVPDIYDFVEPGMPLTPSQAEDQRAWIRYDERVNEIEMREKCQ